MRKGFAGFAVAIVMGAVATGGQAQTAPRGGETAFESASFPTPGTQDTFTVPAGIHTLSIQATGADGGDSGTVQGGRPNQVTLPSTTVTPGQVFDVRVGGLGIDAHGGGPRTGAFNGGGAPGASTFNGGNSIARVAASGGGASDVRPAGGALTDAILVAAGGGGAGASGNPSGPDGGAGGNAGTDGSTGNSTNASERGGSGKAGTASAGGAGGAAGLDTANNQDGMPGTAGALGVGGAGGDGPENSPPGPGGGGGGGYYGGGGGGGGGINTGGSDTTPGSGGGGGGGFSLVPAGATLVIPVAGTPPSVQFYWQRPGTTITDPPKRKIKTKKNAVTVSVGFESSDNGATFECAVDDKAPAACTSPGDFKLRKGKHTISVTAIGGDGNYDDTPATAKVNVKKKKKK